MSTEQEVIDIVAEQLGVDKTEVTPAKSFVEDLNADSLDLTELIMTFEERFGCEISENEAEKLKIKTKKDLDEVDAFGQLIVNSGIVATKSLIENNVQEKTTKGIFTQFIDSCVTFVGSFFNN